jgi:hypothetical protein
MNEFRFADSLIPMTKIVVIIAIPRNATRLNTPVACGSVLGSTLFAAKVLAILPIASHRPLYITNCAPGVPAICGGM